MVWTGQGFPLKTNLEMVQLLKGLEGASDVELLVDKYYEFRHRLKWHYVHDESNATKWVTSIISA